MIIWFNLWLLSNGHLLLVETFETLEQCQAYRQEMEVKQPGDYYCRWVQMDKT